MPSSRPSTPTRRPREAATESPGALASWDPTVDEHLPSASRRRVNTLDVFAKPVPDLGFIGDGVDIPGVARGVNSDELVIGMSGSEFSTPLSHTPRRKLADKEVRALHSPEDRAPYFDPHSQALTVGMASRTVGDGIVRGFSSEGRLLAPGGAGVGRVEGGEPPTSVHSSRSPTPIEVGSSCSDGRGGSLTPQSREDPSAGKGKRKERTSNSSI